MVLHRLPSPLVCSFLTPKETTTILAPLEKSY